ncbi:ZPBP2 protein, partial [Brachypteracias leptosomus]|nr:ZPBP2 protein [Brachypteracias leptosomus]
GLVFIHTESSLYSLPCSPAEMEVADPTYHWVQDNAAPRLLSVTEEGHLLFQHFQAGDSGNYSCTISYTEHGALVSQTFHYSIFGYHVPENLDTVLHFQGKFCGDEWTKSFLWHLQQKLKQLEIQHHCKLQLTSTFCFPSLSKPSDDFVVQVQLEVSPFGPQWDEVCNPQDVETVTDCYHRTVQHNLRQVQLTLSRFFKEHKTFHVTVADVPSTNFTNKFVSILQTNQCSRGYGQTRQLQRCLDCCIVCPPGMFSPPKNTQCSLCPVGTYSLMYGVGFCTPCKDGLITRGPGASTTIDCVNKDQNKQGVLIVHKMPKLILIILVVLIIMNFLFNLISCYWFCREYQMKSPGASEVTESTTRMKTVTSSPQQSSQAGPDAEPAGDISHLDTNASHRGGEEHMQGAPSSAGTPNLGPVINEIDA